MIKRMKVKPFFTDEEFGSVPVNESQDSVCMECGLYKGCISPKMPVTGKGKKEILIIAEAPGKTEDEQNKQLIGDAGKLLRGRLKDCGMDLDEDFWKTNAVICRPPKNRKPKRKELKCCKPNYVKIINELKPKFIWLVGAAAIESYYMDHFADEDGTVLTPTRWRGLCIPDQMSGAWVLPMFHPSFALRNEKDNLLQSQFDRDIGFATSQLNRKPPKFIHPEKRVTVLKEFDDVCENLDKLIYNPPEFLAFDYETTGLKPFNEGHKIACVGYTFDDCAYSFPLEYPHFTSKQVNVLKKMWGEVLRNDSYKIAHNLKYEEVWSRVIIGSVVQNWHWCTMNAAHILDNRKKFTSLKFQSFIRWGVGQYDKSIAPFLKDKTGSGFNKVMEADLDDLLLYNGMDALLTMKLYREQYNEMPVSMMKANDFFIDGLIALADVQINGIPAKRKYYEKTDKDLEDRMKEIIKELLTSKEAKKFEKEMGREISLTSDYDMRDLFFKILKCKPSKSTETGLPSVDAMSLRALSLPFANKLIELSQLDKIKTTYIGQFLREINDDGKLHPFLDLHTVQTYRSSAAGPNIQNIPVRDPVAKQYTRSGLFPSKGNLLLDFDYGALEVRIIGACTGDSQLVGYINDPSTDMHRDQAMQLFRLSKTEVTKMLRFHAKNGFVFAEFYGSYYRSIAMSLWETMKREQLKTTSGVNIFDHLMDNNVIGHENDYDKFENHVKKVEQDFWDRFAGVKKWQKRNWDFYERNGHVELATGFRCSGYMKRNDLANYPIQGPAFHCLLYSLININDELKRRKMGTKIIGQIHDCCIFDCVPSEKKDVKELSTEIATQKIRKDWKWLNVPLILEWEETKVDESWYSKKEIREE
jgi:uracil-DNA glycosylase family 4